MNSPSRASRPHVPSTKLLFDLIGACVAAESRRDLPRELRDDARDAKSRLIEIRDARTGEEAIAAAKSWISGWGEKLVKRREESRPLSLKLNEAAGYDRGTELLRKLLEASGSPLLSSGVFFILRRQ